MLFYMHLSLTRWSSLRRYLWNVSEISAWRIMVVKYRSGAVPLICIRVSIVITLLVGHHDGRPCRPEELLMLCVPLSTDLGTAAPCVERILLFSSSSVTKLLNFEVLLWWDLLVVLDISRLPWSSQGSSKRLTLG